jgi:hypothetical protein
MASRLSPGADDCNRNGHDDGEDIAGGTSADCNENGVPDECDVAPGDFDFPAAERGEVVGEVASLTAGDLDGDNDIDVAVASSPSSEVSVLLNGGDGSFASPAKFTTGEWPLAIKAGDLDGDHDLDLVTANLLGNNLSVLL